MDGALISELFVKQEKADISWFKSRPEAEKFFNRDRYEKEIMEYILLEFAYYNKNKDDGPKLQNAEPVVGKVNFFNSNFEKLFLLESSNWNN